MRPAGVQLVDAELIRGLLERARRSPRLRTNHNFHRSMEENPHRFLNVMVRGTYVAPHRHLDPPKAESFLVLEGSVAFFTFDDEGAVLTRDDLGRGGATGIDVPAGVWHTLAVTGEYAVCYEVKPGPYSEGNDKEFARWAPREGDAGTAEYLDSLLSR